MLDTTELHALTVWCARRAISWRPVSADRTMPAILLEPMNHRGCWQRLLLSVNDDYELATEAGEKLASASDLHSVLDALAGGIGERSATTELPRRTGAAAFVI